MNIDFDAKQRIVHIWLTKEDQRNADVMSQVDKICAASKANNVQVVIYRSGEQDLKTGTLDLLLFNKKKQAEQLQKKTTPPSNTPQRSR